MSLFFGGLDFFFSFDSKHPPPLLSFLQKAMAVSFHVGETGLSCSRRLSSLPSFFLSLGRLFLFGIFTHAVGYLSFWGAVVFELTESPPLSFLFAGSLSWKIFFF